MTGVGGLKAKGAAAKLCQVVVFAAAGIICAPPQAEAALYYWSDFNPGYYYQPRPFAPRWQKPRRRPFVRKSPSPGRWTVSSAAIRASRSPSTGAYAEPSRGS